MYRSNNNNNDSDSTLRNLNEYNQLMRNENNQQDSVNNINVDNNSAIISKYSPSPALSENANNLILRKRELILNSKK